MSKINAKIQSSQIFPKAIQRGFDSKLAPQPKAAAEFRGQRVNSAAWNVVTTWRTRFALSQGQSSGLDFVANFWAS